MRRISVFIVFITLSMGCFAQSGAVKKVADEKGYQAIFDRATSANIIFASPRIDVSNEVLAKLGYSN